MHDQLPIIFQDQTSYIEHQCTNNRLTMRLINSEAGDFVTLRSNN